MRFRAFLAIGLAIDLAIELTGCTLRREIWIYTSLPKDVISELLDPLEADVPDAEVKWYQGTSENVEARLSAELEAGKTKADLVITGDPLWYLEMKRKGSLLAYASPAVKELPANLKDSDNAFAAVRLPVMVLGYNSGALKPSELPERWKDLAQPRFDRKLSMANPLDSAASLTAVSILSKQFGWDYFSSLRKLGIVAEGTQSSVLNRIETGERPIGILPLEIILRAQRGKGAAQPNPAIKPIYPLDGAIQVPGPIAILKDSEHPEAARKVYDWFFSPAAQSAIVRGGAYSPLPKIVSPDGARPWGELRMQVVQWTPGGLEEILAGRERVRAKFSEVVLH